MSTIETHSAGGAPDSTLAALDEREKRAPVGGGIELAYDELGDPAGEPLLLIMGLATQMIHWDEDLCAMFGERGFRVIRFDNRDVGHSTRLDDAPVPGRTEMLLGRGTPVYKLRDLAADTAGLMDHLGLERAHVVGASMGGMVAQALAIGHPERVASLGSIMSSTGNRRLGLPGWRAFGTLVGSPPANREGYVDQAVKTFRVIGSPAYPFDEARFREVVGLAYDRSFYPPGVARQLHAITSSGNRTAHLRRLSLPAVVIHGTSDLLIRPAAGKATARAIPGSHLVLIEGMGHDLPPQLWPQFVEEVAANAARSAPRS